MSGPISVASSSGSPTFSLRVAVDEQLGEPVVRRALDEDRASARSSPAPRCRTPRTAPAAAAFSRSASAKTTFADLPPSSSVTRLIVPRGAAHHLLPDLGRAGEADLRDVRMLDQPLPDDGALADDDVDDALGNAGLERELAEPQRRERRQLRRLQHDGVAARERRPELPRRDVEREVPRRDQADDAERLAERHVDAARDRESSRRRCLSTAPA